jgi:hypothetical protein
MLPIWLNKLREHLGRQAPALMSTLLVTALLLSTVGVARRYFYCAGMDQSLLESCCPHRGGEAVQGADEAQLRATPESCCETREFRVGAPGIEARVPTVPPVPIAAVQVAISLPRSASDQVLQRLPPTRAGPRPPAAQRAQLQVYLC